MKSLNDIYRESIIIVSKLRDKIVSLDKTVIDDALILKENIKQGYPLDDGFISTIYQEVIEGNGEEFKILFKEVVQVLECYNEKVFSLNIDLSLAKAKENYDLAMAETIEDGISTIFNLEKENTLAIYELFNNYSLYAISVRDNEILDKILSRMASL